MIKSLAEPLRIVLAARAQEVPHLMEEHRQTLSLQLWPLLEAKARHIMGRQTPGGLNISEPYDLAAAGLEKLLLRWEAPQILRFNGHSEGELATYIHMVLTNLLLDDQRRLHGRVPRIWMDVQDENGDEFLPSQRRTVTGYLLLRQTQNHLYDYLDQMPGAIVEVPTQVRNKTAGPGSKRVTLTENHAKLLCVWMSGEGLEQWNEIALEMQRPVGTVKRWWSEAVRAFMTDNSAQAQALRSLYRIPAVHINLAERHALEPDTEDERSEPVVPSWD